MVGKTSDADDPLKIGILALQGATREHRSLLGGLDVDCIDIKQASHLTAIDGLIIPGGESTVIRKLMAAAELVDPIVRLARQGMPVFGTCAGLILMASSSDEEPEQPLGFMDIMVRRNAYGRQVASFEAKVTASLGELSVINAIFIRAPMIETVGVNVKVLASLGRRPVLVEENQFLACAFHPELAEDSAIHRYFVDKVKQARTGLNEEALGA